MIWKLFLIGTALLGGMLLVGCGKNEKPTQTTTEVMPVHQVTIPKFEKDSAYAFVAKQVAFGPRVPNTESHRQCRDWLAAQLKKYGATLILQDFTAKAYTGTVYNGTNIIGQFNPAAKKRILLAAHWDTRYIADSKLSTERRNEPIDGADDGGSGVAVLLEIARQLQANPIDMGVDIIFFDAEDNGQHSETPRPEAEELKAMESWCLGSQHWSKNLHVSGYKPKYGILLDMVGARNARFPKEGYSRQMAGPLQDKIWKLAKSMGYGNYFVDDLAGGITDDHFFVGRNAGIPMIDIIHLADGDEHTFGTHWHTHQDNMDIIDGRTLRAVGQLVLAVVYKESAGAF